MSYRSENLAADIRRKLNDDDYWLTRRPICDECGQHIQEEQFFMIDGKRYCQACIEGFEVYTDDYI